VLARIPIRGTTRRRDGLAGFPIGGVLGQAPEEPEDNQLGARWRWRRWYWKWLCSHYNSGAGGSGVIIVKYVPTAAANITYAFKGTNSWTCPPGVTSVDYLIVAGGGGGGLATAAVVVLVVLELVQEFCYSRNIIYSYSRCWWHCWYCNITNRSMVVNGAFFF
jgi:hypothetical protein